MTGFLALSLSIVMAPAAVLPFGSKCVARGHAASLNRKRFGPRIRKESMYSTRGSLRSRCGNSSSKASSTMRASSRASEAPRQKWLPKPTPGVPADCG